MAGSILDGLSAVLLPKGKGVKGGRGYTPTYNSRDPVIRTPLYREHLNDIYTSRTANDARTLLATLVNHDPDVSAAINAYLTVSGSVDPVISAYNEKDEIDVAGIAMGQQLMALLTTNNDYTQGYSHKPTVDTLVTDCRYMLLLRGMLAAELVLDKTYVPNELRIVDAATIEWHQPKPGVYQPVQRPVGSNDVLDLNIPTFFTTNFHQSPADVYAYSPFISAINTIAARAAVINELYRIMQIVGYPRLDVKVLEEVLVANAPPAFRNDQAAIRLHVENELQRVRSAITTLGSGDAFVHSSAIETKIINEKNPAAGIQIDNVIEVLNAQNQASLKVMPAVIGKGGNGQVASTEARLFAMSADALNRPVAGLLTKALTLGARLAGYPGRIEATFPPVEMRPVLELEPQKTMKSSRLKQDLSLGLITDIEYSMEMYGRPPLPGAPVLSGTGFLAQAPVSINTDNVSSQSDPTGRNMSGAGGNGVATDNKAAAGGGGNAANKPPARTGKLTFEMDV